MKRVLVLLWLLASSVPGHAEPGAAAPMSEEARALLALGEKLYEAGDYTGAIEAFDRGLKLQAHPDFLYAKAQAYRKQGDCVNADAQYRAFLATNPPEDEAARARANLERCTPKEPATPTPTPPRFPPPPPPPPPHAAWYRDRLGGALAASGVLGLAVGATFLILGERDIRAANDATTLGELDDLGGKGRRERWIGAGCALAGGALAVGGAVRYARVRRTGRARAASTIAVSPQRAGISIWWSGGF